MMASPLRWSRSDHASITCPLPDAHYGHMTEKFLRMGRRVIPNTAPPGR